MPVHMDWLSTRKRIVCVVARGQLEFEEVVSAADLLRAMGKSVSHPIAAIIDVEPPPFFSQRYGESLRRVHEADFPNLEVVVFVGDTIVWEIFWLFSREIEHLPYHLVMTDTFEEAVEYIQTYRLEASAPPASSVPWN